MSRRAATFTQADIARVMRAAVQTGLGAWRIRVTREGEIVVEPVDVRPEPQWPVTIIDATSKWVP